MNITLGMVVHNIFKREWLQVIKIDGDIVFLKGYQTLFEKMTKNDFVRMVKSSPLNKGVQI